MFYSIKRFFNTNNYINITLIFCSIVLLSIECTPRYKGPKIDGSEKYAMIIGREQKSAKRPGFKSYVLFEDTKILKIAGVDNIIEKMFARPTEVALYPGSRTVIVYCFIGKPGWRLIFFDTLQFDAKSDETYYLDCGPGGAWICKKPPEAKIENPPRCPYLKMYNGELKLDDNVALLTFGENIRISRFESKMVTFCWAYTDNDYIGFEILPGSYIVYVRYFKPPYQGEKELPIEINVGEDRKYEIRAKIITDDRGYKRWKPIIVELKK